MWIIGIIVTATAGKSSKNYEWELMGVNNIVLEAAGFALLIFGTLVYNGNIRLCCIADTGEAGALELQEEPVS